LGVIETSDSPKRGKAGHGNGRDRARNGAPGWHPHFDILYVLVGR